MFYIMRLLFVLSCEKLAIVFVYD